MKVLLIFVGLLSLVNANAQTEKNDPAATAILTKVKTKYNAFKTLQMDFVMTTEVPEQKSKIEAGTMAQAGKKYRVSLPQVVTFSDGSVTWTYIKKNNEIQINDAKSGGAMASIAPKQLLKIYESKDFIHALTGQGKHDGILCHEIEFKPVNRRTDFFKIRIVVEKGSNNIKSVKAFYKDGVRIILDMKKQITNTAIPAAQFTYKASEFPGVPVEDLRLD